MDKKGVAPVIATVLLIVIVVVAIALVVAFVMPMIKDSMAKSKACSEARLTIEYACYNNTHVIMRVSRGAEEFGLDGALVQLINDTTTKTQTLTATQLDIDALGSKTIYVPWSTKPTAVGIAPKVKIAGRNQPVLCDVIATVLVSTQCP